MVQIYGYPRVPKREQNEGRQLFAMREFAIQDDKIFLDKLSGKDIKRPAYRRLIKKARRHPCHQEVRQTW